MKEFSRKKYSIEIQLPFLFFFKKKRAFVYFQGTFEQLLEMASWVQNDKDIRGYVYHFLNTYTDGKIRKKHMAKMGEIELNKVYLFITSTFAKGFYEKKTEWKLRAARFKNSPAPRTDAPECAFFASMAEKLGWDNFMNMTWEQIDHLSTGLLFNANEGSDEGRRENDKWIAVVEFDKEQKGE